MLVYRTDMFTALSYSYFINAKKRIKKKNSRPKQLQGQLGKVSNGAFLSDWQYIAGKLLTEPSSCQLSGVMNYKLKNTALRLGLGWQTLQAENYTYLLCNIYTYMPKVVGILCCCAHQ